MPFAALSHPVLTDGQDIAPFPVLSELTVAQAARLLNSPVGFVHELLDDGLLEFRQEEGQRLVQWNSLADFGQARERRYQALESIFLQFQEMGLNDD